MFLLPRLVAMPLRNANHWHGAALLKQTVRIVTLKCNQASPGRK